MVVGKGGKNRKKAKNLGVGDKRELTFKEEGQEYAQVLRMLGKLFLALHVIGQEVEDWRPIALTG